MAAQSWRLDANRWRFQHGPIDLVLALFAREEERMLAAAQAWRAFDGLLDTLVTELPRLRCGDGPRPNGPVAGAMTAAVEPHTGQFVTPMAAVAGAVADHVLTAAVKGRRVERAFVNNGGDIAIFLTSGQRFDAGIVGDISDPAIDAGFVIEHQMPVRGIATSGWRGRSHSLGIADCATVLSGTAAAADAAATLLANAVNAEHPAISRSPACDLDPDSDLGKLPVTVDVGNLPRPVIRQALADGQAAARRMIEQGLIFGALIRLQNDIAAVGQYGRPLVAA
jgi:ApbE superfamily uncharacterized protein (UPF0280 family)